eukprot:scaffold16006_cov70-Cyclotella_meneghiniana.AAC.3
MVSMGWLFSKKLSLISVHFNTKIGCLMEAPNHNCSTLTVPMSHCMYIKWLGIVETAMHYLQWSPRTGFSVMVRELFGIGFVHFNTPRLGVLWSPQTRRTDKLLRYEIYELSQGMDIRAVRNRMFERSRGYQRADMTSNMCPNDHDYDPFESRVWY